ncbi:class I SAM-dependent methyltransferase [Streptomyces sparsus]
MTRDGTTSGGTTADSVGTTGGGTAAGGAAMDGPAVGRPPGCGTERRTPGEGAPGSPDQAREQGRYHRELFPALLDWQRTIDKIVEFTGDSAPSGLIGFDQMGHFGPNGCDRVADVIGQAFAGSAVRLVELGSGFGGALRHLADGLPARDVTLRSGTGVDLVAEHCEVSARISHSQGRRNLTELCASAEDVPLPDGATDVVVITGSVPHFPRPDLVFREARRLLRTGGLLVVTEEVSLVAPGAAPAGEFRRLHPEGVFFLTEPAVRRRQLRDARFTLVLDTDLGPWATALLSERLRAVRLFRGSVDTILGAESANRVHDTLETALAEYRAGRLLPRMFVGRAA